MPTRIAGILMLMAAVALAAEEPAAQQVQVDLFTVSSVRGSKFTISGKSFDSWTQSTMGFARSIPHRYTERGVIEDRTGTFMIRAATEVQLKPGKYRVVMRSLNAARLMVDGKSIGSTAFIRGSGDAHGKIDALAKVIDSSLHPPAIGHNDRLISLELGGKHRFVLEAVVGGRNLRPEVGDLMVAIALEGEPFRLVSSVSDVAVDDAGWPKFFEQEKARLAVFNAKRRRDASSDTDAYWAKRHAEVRTAIGARPQAPAASKTPVHNDIDRYIGAKLAATGTQPTILIDDHAFIRRLSLDIRGVVPAPAEIAAFMADQKDGRRARLIDRFLIDPRWADHWTSYWQDVLAENPGIVKPKLNNTGPFRWWIHESMLDNKPMDRFVTELVMMEGSAYRGGPAGFAMATQNDVPMAAKAHILGTAFLGVEMKCARCHDAPFHDLKQQQLFSMAAMLGRRAITVPKSSSIPLSPEEIKKMIVEVTLQPGQKVLPVWTFSSLMDEKAVPEHWLTNPKDTRQKLAALITSPANKRFAQVLANRLWKRLMGAGLVEPVSDWEDQTPSHPKLLQRLGWELAHAKYDLKHVAKMIFNSHAYQRRAVGDATRIPKDQTKRLFAGPMRRRMSAEQIVDSLFAVAGKRFATESMTMDGAARGVTKNFSDLGQPTRAWEFCSLSNERDRPSLGLPRAQSVIDVLTTFGWRQARPDPTTQRDSTVTALQPLIMANGTVATRIATFSDDSAFTTMSLDSKQTPQTLVQAMFRRVLSREPSDQELAIFVSLISEGFANRIDATAKIYKKETKSKAHLTWTNHFAPKASRLKLEQERTVRAGDRPTQRLVEAWRLRAEDTVWALINTPEFLFVP
jgi:hypothetical protein